MAIDAVVLSTPDVSYRARRVHHEGHRPVLPEKLLTKKTKYYINPTGRFVGGPMGDSG